MTSIPLPLGSVTCYFVRHGERVDHIDADWVANASIPYDPPLTAEGTHQARKTGALIYNLEKQALLANPQRTEYLVLTSPFLRCAQTSEGIFHGFEQSWKQNKADGMQDPSSWRLAVEPGLSEVMSESYFDMQIPNSLIARRREELGDGRGIRYANDYAPVHECMPVYPEGFQNMMARFVSTLDVTATRQIDQMSRDLIAASGNESGPLNTRRVIIFVTHGAGIGSFLWATAKQLGFNNITYCCVTRALVTGRKSSQPLPAFGTSRMPAYSWHVDYNAYSEHLANL
ncbi:hypothetical protein GGI25_001066 [Coemansia spiralis]|uniref:Phosphoglycerate mutase-like protein n=2 Tax=Coemansia TaxID=4863 RepID=A0A9W8L0L3_9FUNG|nr:histidine phosphatase superfamily [Coemansia spiralis]KAJ1995498.1 hypothetical protein EDC05_000736 [Coemansia umbellata]KAJ2625169.1 hypothetical protein GGI26_000972 [Coemansia sp. RSA 1358]KAJ2679877.1 hypothetical protein GGI25_001066 [Coemansia spiralis]